MNFEASLEPITIKEQNHFIFRTFLWMFAGLLVTAVTAWFAYSTGFFIILFSGKSLASILIMELVVVLVFSFAFSKLPPAVVGALFFAYAVINGITISTIFIVYQLSSIVLLFVAASALFGGFALYGYSCTKDLSNWRPLLMITLIVAIVMSAINFFILKSNAMELFLDCGVLFLFFGITVYDMNRIKNWSMMSGGNNKMYIYGAMELYLDFINIFLRLLSLFGKSRD